MSSTTNVSTYLTVTETWMKARQPAVTRDIAPTGYDVIHRFRRLNDGGGVPHIYVAHLRVAAVEYEKELSGADCLASKILTRRGRLNIAVVYRPPVRRLVRFLSEFGELDELFGVAQTAGRLR